MHATSRPRGETDAEAQTWAIEADDYQTAFDEAIAGVPEGSVLLCVRVEH